MGEEPVGPGIAEKLIDLFVIDDGGTIQPVTIVQPAGGAAPGAPGPGGLGEPPGAGAGFPVPPLDLPHYHGVGVVVPTGQSRADQGATQADTVKEVTGA